jgi:hypothetical protein
LGARFGWQLDGGFRLRRRVVLARARSLKGSKVTATAALASTR